MTDKDGSNDLLSPDSTGDSPAKRGDRGRFLPGQSGNPAGRPVGSRNKAQALVANRLNSEWEAVADSLVREARRGNATAAKAVLDRVAPPPRGRVVQLNLPHIFTLDDVDAAVDSVLAAVSAGHVSPQEAATIAGILETKRRVLESRALDDRVRTLEEKLEGVPLH